jgi:hypothetical protein
MGESSSYFIHRGQQELVREDVECGAVGEGALPRAPGEGRRLQVGRRLHMDTGVLQGSREDLGQDIR